MDRNSVIGIVLMCGIMLLYVTFFAEEPIAPKQKVKEGDSTLTEVQDTRAQAPALPDSLQQAVDRQRLGTLAAGARGEEKEIVLENSRLRVTFSSKGGKVKKVLVKDYRTFDGKPVYLVTEESSLKELLLPTAAGDIDLYSLYYQAAQDGSSVSFSLPTGQGEVRQQYTLEPDSYLLHYSVSLSGMSGVSGQANATLHWKDDLLKLEKDMEQSRARAAINYYTAEGDFEDLGSNKLELVEETVSTPVKWVNFKQKFFSSAIISDSQLTGMNIKTSAQEDDTTIVKTMEATITLPVSDLRSGSGFTYYYGPNDIKVMEKVTEGFDRNVSLGWTIFSTINRYTILPLFRFLERFIASYGIIIIILVVIVKLLLSPLSYKSYVSMAKTKVLKPELDKIRERTGDDQQKFQQEQMALYQQMGVNPISGCVPMLLQMPIFLALFNFFPNAIELRQEGFLWADDLSSYDSVAQLPFTIPFYGDHVSLFTLLMAVSTIAYTWYNNQINTTATGPMKNISYIMPVFMIFFLNSYASGLTLYYFISNIITIGQQFVIGQFVDESKIRAKLEENSRNRKHKKKGRFAQRIEEAMKMQEEQKTNRQLRRGGKK